MQIKTLQSFAMQDATGKLTIYAFGEIVNLDDEIAQQLIDDGLAVKYDGGGGGEGGTTDYEALYNQPTISIGNQKAVLIKNVDLKARLGVLTASDKDELNNTINTKEITLQADIDTKGRYVELSYDKTTEKLYAYLKDKSNATISNSSVDLILEGLVVGGSYNSTNKTISLSLKDVSDPIVIPVGDLVDGLLSESKEKNKVYGTDDNGNQKLYNKDDFGKVDDVQLAGISIVNNKIANITPSTTLSSLSTDDEIPSAKASYKLFDDCIVGRETQLWSGSMGQGTATLSQGMSNFTYLKILIHRESWWTYWTIKTSDLRKQLILPLAWGGTGDGYAFITNFTNTSISFSVGGTTKIEKIIGIQTGAISQIGDIKTELYIGTSVKNSITLSDSVNNYDEILFISKDNYNWHRFDTIPVSVWLNLTSKQLLFEIINDRYTGVNSVSSDGKTLAITTNGGAYMHKVIGIKKYRFITN